MGMSRSVRKRDRCIGGALIFSGRPNPTWKVDEATVRRSEKIWSSLKAFSGSLPTAPPLGYRGCFLKCSPDLEWFAYGGVATLRKAWKSESRRDEDRKFETLLLASAPEGTLPTSLAGQK